jgi:exodeoxyribonuclease-3
MIYDDGGEHSQARLAAHAAELYGAGAPVVLAGDYNVVPTDRDIYPTRSYAGNALIQPQSRAAFRRILDQGWTDAVRTLHLDAPMYTFWDYMRNRWPRGSVQNLSQCAGRPATSSRCKSDTMKE